ncbi:hypothetical protein M5J06_11675 [Corynebacterium sp. B5-R-101]|uniref:Uncharacterized protein n=1 Tax=Corynebacterium intestinale TaxID=2943492 RepID=A0ABT0TCH0_9CORY|nr:hypothetical protein [Corynebacterium intestinale]MCL8494770.1 hypothetical protein [Corynebacterium intestinale]MCP1391006.1 hypothetical protein [Corynebacterium intestinale]
MAEHSITPYLFSLAPKGKPTEILKMGNVCSNPELTGSDFAANCFYQLVKEEDPRVYGTDSTRLLEGMEVLRSGDQVLFKMRVGIKGFNSNLDLASLGTTATRKFGDAEWFTLRALFVSIQGGRKALLLVERVANYSAYGIISELFKNAARVNLKRDLTARFEPIQDIRTMGQNLGEMITKSVEFRVPLARGESEIEEEAAGEDEVNPLDWIARASLKRATKYTVRGGFGQFSKFRNKSTEELAQTFGYYPENLEETEVVATVETARGKSRTISILDEETPSVSFSIEREIQDEVPTDAEFLATADFVIEGTSNLTDIDSRPSKNIDSFEEVGSLQSFEVWKLDE